MSKAEQQDAEGVAAGPGGHAVEESRATLRLCRIAPDARDGHPAGTTSPSGSCGFHISRTQWDPYPWVSAVELGSPAEQAGLRTGDCVLEVNGEDVLGQRIGEVAAKVRAGRAQDRLQLLVWNAGCDPASAVTLTAGSGPTPLNLQLLSSCLQQASQLLECPVCLEGVSPPVWQCCHGHLLCSGCRARSERCPLCRVPLGPRGRSLLADKLHELLSQTHRRYADQRAGHADEPPAAADARPAAAAAAAPPADQRRKMSAPASTTAASTSDAGDHRAHVLMRGLRLAASNEDVSELTAASHLAPPPAAPPGRARSHSAGHIDAPVASEGAEAATEAAEAAADKGPHGWVHCPYGSACSTTCPASEVFNHLRDDHDGPLTQYFPREGRQLYLPHPKRKGSLTALTTKTGDTMFLHAEAGRMWLWALAPTAGAAPAAAASSDAVLCVDFPDDASGDHRVAPVFPLTASIEDVIASGRCVRVPDGDMQISVRMAAAASATSASSTTSEPSPAAAAR